MVAETTAAPPIGTQEKELPEKYLEPASIKFEASGNMELVVMYMGCVIMGGDVLTLSAEWGRVLNMEQTSLSTRAQIADTWKSEKVDRVQRTPHRSMSATYCGGWEEKTCAALRPDLLAYGLIRSKQDGNIYWSAR